MITLKLLYSFYSSATQTKESVKIIIYNSCQSLLYICILHIYRFVAIYFMIKTWITTSISNESLKNYKKIYDKQKVENKTKKSQFLK